MSGDIIQLNPEAFQTELKSLVKNSIEETLNAMLDEEAKKLVNAERYAREEERSGLLPLYRIFPQHVTCFIREHWKEKKRFVHGRLCC